MPTLAKDPTTTFRFQSNLHSGLERWKTHATFDTGSSLTGRKRSRRSAASSDSGLTLTRPGRGPAPFEGSSWDGGYRSNRPTNPPHREPTRPFYSGDQQRSPAGPPHRSRRQGNDNRPPPNDDAPMTRKEITELISNTVAQAVSTAMAGIASASTGKRVLT